MSISNFWKIEREIYYPSLYYEHGMEFVTNAGFFFDSQKESTIPYIDPLCTPLAFLKRGLTKPAVLLSTGSFCPLHEGHIQMMEAAREAVEAAGYQVAGGYLSPGHDEYIKSKTGKDWIPIHNRIAMIRAKIKDHSWLNVDPWEGVFAPGAVNFTTIIQRMRYYLNRYYQRDVPVFFVCGGDNARFAQTFLKEGHCVVVDRPPYKAFEDYDHFASDRIIFTKGGITMSSSKIREENKFVPSEKKVLHLRLDSSKFAELMVVDELEPYFKEIIPHHVRDQRRTFRRLANTASIISLDPILYGDYDIKMSREYDLYGLSLLGYTNRPGSENLENQVKKIPPGDYTLFDDDIATGNTIRAAKRLIESGGRRVKSVMSLNISSPEDGEILDAKDFLFGQDPDGGLVVRLPSGEKARVPYMYPYVDPFVRASVLDPLQFSIDMWALNMELVSGYKTTVEEVPHLKPLLSYPDFGCVGRTLFDVCKYHHSALVRLKEFSV